MKENLTSVNVLIDNSGSMGKLTNDTIGGFNAFLAEQKNVPGDVLFTLYAFNDRYHPIHDFIPLAHVSNLNEKTYRTGGGTALLDALGTMIDNVGQKLAAMPEEERPSKVIFLVITDGEENSSCKYTLDQVRSMVTHQTEKYNWSFVFMGANIDAISAGTNLGIAATNSVNYTASSIGTKSLYRAVSSSLGNYRTVGNNQANFFNQSDLDLINDSSNNPESLTVVPKSQDLFMGPAQDLFGINDLFNSNKPDDTNNSGNQGTP